MRIEIHTGKFTLTDSLREHAERRLRFALSRAQQKLQKVILRLDDLNGPKGGADKSCRIQIPLAGEKSIVIHEIQCDLYHAIDRAVDRAGRTVSRKIERRRDQSLRHNKPSLLLEDGNW